MTSTVPFRWPKKCVPTQSTIMLDKTTSSAKIRFCVKCWIRTKCPVWYCGVRLDVERFGSGNEMRCTDQCCLPVQFCFQTTLAHIIAKQCKTTENSRFVKLSATMCGVNEVKEVIKVAANDRKFKRKTILFMDEIHRFNKLQQVHQVDRNVQRCGFVTVSISISKDIFLPHVESGAITLIGATTENPSFSLNSALLSRCRVIILEKIDSACMYQILCRSLRTFDAVIQEGSAEPPKIAELGFIPK